MIYVFRFASASAFVPVAHHHPESRCGTGITVKIDSPEYDSVRGRSLFPMVSDYASKIIAVEKTS